MPIGTWGHDDRRVGLDYEDTGPRVVARGVEQARPQVEVVVAYDQELAPGRLPDRGSACLSEPVFVVLRSCAHRLLVAVCLLGVVALWHLLVFAVALDALSSATGERVEHGREPLRPARVADDDALLVAGDDLGDRGRPGAAPAVGDADRSSARVLRERGDIGPVENGAAAVVELAGSPADEGLSLRRLEVGREFAVECCRDDVASPGADVDVPFIAKSREAVAEFGFDADLEYVCTSHDMTQ